jgi:hypothetical protein
LELVVSDTVFDLIGLRDRGQNLRVDFVVLPVLWRMERTLRHERWLDLGGGGSIIIKGTSKKLWSHALSITQAIGVKNPHG